MNFIEELCKGQPDDVQTKIKAAYWQGCAEGIVLAEKPIKIIDRQEDNVVYLRRNKNDATR